MKPHTIINQTLHSYCKEQYEFNTLPMLINLTEYCLLFFPFKTILFSYLIRWPSGFIYSYNPYKKFGMKTEIELIEIVFFNI
jgi:hypothetical protein